MDPKYGVKQVIIFDAPVDRGSMRNRLLRNFRSSISEADGLRRHRLSPRPPRSCSSIGRNLRTSLVPANAPSPRAAGAPLSSSLRSRCKNRSSRCGAL
eukprot:scaffold16775_cov58-Phaeocystis_antarctica.AAC.1